MTAISINNIHKKLSLVNLIEYFENLDDKILIPKPKGNSEFLGWREVRGSQEKALFYRIGKKSQKNIKKRDWDKTLYQLSNFGYINRFWFQTNIEKAKNNPCNFTSIGGVLTLYGLVESSQTGSYQLKEPYLSSVLKNNLKKSLIEVSDIEASKIKGKSLNELLDEY